MGYTSGCHGRNRSGSMRRLAPWGIGAQRVGILLAGKGVVVVEVEVVLRVDSLHGAVTHQQLNFKCYPYVYIYWPRCGLFWLSGGARYPI